MGPKVKAFFDPQTNTISYVVRDPNGHAAAIIDSVLDFDHASGTTQTSSADKIIAYVKDQTLDIQWLRESHVHADHLSAAPYIQDQLGGRIGIGNNITLVQDTFGKVFNEGPHKPYMNRFKRYSRCPMKQKFL
jgi:glyoxylase-like metal-dependent hydrolase (beta-lactamase superfamily II)